MHVTFKKLSDFPAKVSRETSIVNAIGRRQQSHKVFAMVLNSITISCSVVARDVVVS